VDTGTVGTVEKEDRVVAEAQEKKKEEEHIQ
jgi:hypothetical protein